jgi:hypothetical protein
MLDHKLNAKCLIDLFYTGHGQYGMIQLAKSELYSYRTLINDIVTGINKHTITLYKKNDLTQI